MTAAEAEAVLREYAATLGVGRDAPAEELYRFLDMQFFRDPVSDPWRGRLISAAWVLLYGDDRHLRGWAHKAMWGAIHDWFDEPLLVRAWPPDPDALQLMMTAMQTAPNDVRERVAAMLLRNPDTAGRAAEVLAGLLGPRFTEGTPRERVEAAVTLLAVPAWADRAAEHLLDVLLDDDADGEDRFQAFLALVQNPEQLGPARARITAAAADPQHPWQWLARDILNRWSKRA